MAENSTPQQTIDKTRLFVNGLPKELKESELESAFSKFGDLTDCTIRKNDKGKSRQIAFIGYKTEAEAVLAQKKMDGSYLHTRKINVNFSHPIGTASLENTWARKLKRAPPSATQKTKADKYKPQDSSLKDDPEFQDFLAQAKPRNLRPSWNDGPINPSEIVPYRDSSDDSSGFNSDSDDSESNESKDNNEKEEGQSSKSSKSSDKTDHTGPKTSKSSEQNDQKGGKKENKDFSNTTRIYITNIPYTATEPELRQKFESYGEITEITIPVDSSLGRPAGYAFINFSTRDPVDTLLQESVIFEGRHLRINRAEPPKKKEEVIPDDDEKFVDKKKRLSRVQKPESWNALFLNPETIAEVIADRLGIEKREVLDKESNNVVAQLAAAETQLINETKEMFESAGINLEAFNSKLDERNLSNTLIIVKNLKYETTQEEINALFSTYGTLRRCLLAPSHATALVEFVKPVDAKKALRTLSFKKIHDRPIMLQFAPAGAVESASTSSKIHPDEEFENDEAPKKKVELLKTTTLIVKNVPFQANRKEIYEVCKAFGRIKAVRMPTKSDRTGHRGFAFLDFNTRQEATSAFENLKDVHIYGRHLIVQPAEVGRNIDSVAETPNTK